MSMGSARLSELLPERTGRGSGGGSRLPGMNEEIRLLCDAGYLTTNDGNMDATTASLRLTALGRVAVERLTFLFQREVGQTQLARDAVTRVLRRAGARVTWIGQDLYWLADSGKVPLLYCPRCGFAGLPDRTPVAYKAGAASRQGGAAAEAVGVGAPSEVATPGATTIAKLCAALGIEPEQTIKTMFFRVGTGSTIVAAVLRGDREVSLPKLAALFGLEAVAASLATKEELAAAGIPAGFASPIGLIGTPVIVDRSVEPGVLYVAGANRPDFHLVNVVFPRDFAATMVNGSLASSRSANHGGETYDIAVAQPGDACPAIGCDGELERAKGVLLGRETPFSATLDLDWPLVLAACVSLNRDSSGIAWPSEFAPLSVYLVAIGREKETRRTADAVFAELARAGLSVLYDDRETGPGVKLKDADLLGIPLRLVVSDKTLAAGGAELKRRRAPGNAVEPNAAIIPLADLINALKISDTNRRYD